MTKDNKEPKRKRRPMSEISKSIKENRRRRPTQTELNELFEILKDEGLANPIDKVAKGPEAEPTI